MISRLSKVKRLLNPLERKTAFDYSKVRSSNRVSKHYAKNGLL